MRSKIGRRALKNVALGYLMLIDNVGVDLAWKQFQHADNMTDKASALSCLVNCPAAQEQAASALAEFEEAVSRRGLGDESMVADSGNQLAQPDGLSARQRHCLSTPRLP